MGDFRYDDAKQREEVMRYDAQSRAELVHRWQEAHDSWTMKERAKGAFAAFILTNLLWLCGLLFWRAL